MLWPCKMPGGVAPSPGPPPKPPGRYDGAYDSTVFNFIYLFILHERDSWSFKGHKTITGIGHLHSFPPSPPLGKPPAGGTTTTPGTQWGKGSILLLPSLTGLRGCHPKPCFHHDHPHVCAPQRGAFPCCIPGLLQHPHPPQGWVLRPAGSRPRTTSV